MMKKYFMLMCLAAACGFASCSDDEDKKTPVTESATTVKDVPASTEDQLTHTTGLPAVVIGDQFDGVAKAFVDRLDTKLAPTAQNLAQAQVVVVDCHAIVGMEKSTLRSLTDASSHAAIVWADPSEKAENQLFDKIFELLQEEDDTRATTRSPLTRAAEGEVARTFSCARMEEDDPGQPYADLVVNYGGDVHLVADFDDPDGNPIELTIVDSLSADEEQGLPAQATKKNQVIQATTATTPRQMGTAADEVVDWIETRTSQVRGGNLDDMLSAQQVFMTVPVRNEVEGNVCRYATATMHLDIWSVYDFEKKADFVMVHQSGICYNGDLDYALKDGEGWSVMFGDTEWICNGPYMERVTLSAWLDAQWGWELMNPKPDNTNRGTSATSGFSWNFGGNLGLSDKGLSGGLSGGVSFTKSFSTSTPEIRVENNCAPNGKVSWSYIGPESHWDRKTFFHPHTHPTPARAQIGTFSGIDNTWTWKFEDPRDKHYFTAQMEVTLANELIHRWPSIKRSPRKTYFPKSSNNIRVEIDQPNRSMQKVHIFPAVDVDDKLNRFLERYKELYKTEATIYDLTDESTRAVDKYVDTMRDTFDAHKEEWIKAGLTGKYEFAVYRNNKPYTSFVIDCTPLPVP